MYRSIEKTIVYAAGIAGLVIGASLSKVTPQKETKIYELTKNIAYYCTQRVNLR